MNPPEGRPKNSVQLQYIIIQLEENFAALGVTRQHELLGLMQDYMEPLADDAWITIQCSIRKLSFP